VLFRSARIALFNYSVPGRVRTEVDQQLAASARVFERIVDSRIDQLGTGAQLLAKDFGFRSAVASGDQPTVLSALQNQQARMGADFAMVLNLEGEVLAVLNNSQTPSPTPHLPDQLKLEAEANGVSARVLNVGDRLHQIVLVPIVAPVTVAWIAFGMELDAKTAQSFAALFPIALEVEFLRRADADQVLSDPDFVRRTLPLTPGPQDDNSATVLLSYPVEVALAPFRDLVFNLMLVLGIGMVVLVAASMAISRNLTRPLRELAAATGKVADGDYREVMPPMRDRELSELTTSFNRMVAAVKDREQQLRHLATHDADTGLPNGLAFADTLAKRVVKGSPFALVLAEVQHLPELRSVLNHTNVNELMAAVGDRLQRICGADVATLSTETFALIIDIEPDPGVMTSIIRNSFLTPFTVAKTTIDVSVRMGLVVHESGGMDLATMLRQAHAALDRARTAPTGTAWYDPEIASSHARNLSLMSDLREALTTGEVAFAYQPKFDQKLGRITAVEALVRWQSPTRGFVSPDDFIPLAEKTGDIRLLTTWGLGEAISQVAAWRADGRELAVAVNISAGDLMDRELPQRVRDLLKQHNVPASALHLEVTESAVMHDPDRALEVLDLLASMGVKLAIDDFGTGYSSLGYLKRLPVSELKIDKSFVINLANSEEDQILVRSTIELGHNLGLTVTAEGVEDQATVELLNSYGCDMLQGYHLGRPVPASKLELMLEEPSHA